MARPHLNVIAQWGDCSRCRREQHRLGVFASTWPPRTRVVVFFSAASRASQVAKHGEPGHLRVVEAIADALGLDRGECTSDVLTACGLGNDPTPDEVAACSARFGSQVHPQVVVLFGQDTQRLATQAGLLENGAWAPCGVDRASPVVVASTLEDAVQGVAQALGIIIRHEPVADRRGLVALAPALQRLLGYATGFRRLTPRQRNWKTYSYRSLTLPGIRKHLRGVYWVAPFRPHRFWRYVVIDIDRHSAVQEQYFDRTLAGVRRLFPGACVLRSSDSGGAHVYVALPDGVGYEEAALIVDAFLLGRGLRWVDIGADRKVRTIVTEVPRHPVRLPFGRGARIWDDQRPLDAQFRTLERYLLERPSDDFVTARTEVEERLRFRGAWSLSKKRKLEGLLLDEEVRGLDDLPFEAADPCAAVAERLPRALRKVLRHGVPVYGSRTTWTLRLIATLAEHLPPEEVGRLLDFWLQNRSHVSEDIDVRRQEVRAQTKLFVRRHNRRGIGAVPQRFWRRVEVHVRKVYAMVQTPQGRHHLQRGTAPTPPLPPQFSIDQLLDTAFHILKRFYRSDRNLIRLHHDMYFARFVGRNNAHYAELLLTHLEPGEVQWLAYVPAPNELGAAGNRTRRLHSRRYKLLRGFWPTRPHEKLLFCRP